MSIAPVELPKHCTLVTLPLIDSGAEGWVTVKLPVAVQIPELVTVTVYVPAARLTRSSVIAPLLQEYPYGGVPPLDVMSIDPVVLPKQRILLTVPFTARPDAG